jgi:hypothetical protein
MDVSTSIRDPKLETLDPITPILHRSIHPASENQENQTVSERYLEVTYSPKGAFLPKASYYPKGTTDTLAIF